MKEQLLRARIQKLEAQVMELQLQVKAMQDDQRGALEMMQTWAHPRAAHVVGTDMEEP